MDSHTTENRASLQQCIVEFRKLLPGKVERLQTGYQRLADAYRELYVDHFLKYWDSFQVGEDFARKNLAVVNIYVQSNTIEIWTQSWRHTFWTLSCNLGGALGLFVGASIASILEFIYIFGKYLQKKKRQAIAKHAEAAKAEDGDERQHAKELA
ncbi:unnamed protein product, partial [Mesorhabditis spiculigera]